MVYITGDIHGDLSYLIHKAQQFGITKNDILVLLGDVGVNYYLDDRDYSVKKLLDKYIDATILCIHGNHEARPATIDGYYLTAFAGGRVWAQPEFPKLLFAHDGDIFTLEGKKCLVLGGAYSVDKFYRLANGWAWFEDEQPSDEIKAHVAEQLININNKIDIVFSHTCPLKYEPIEVFLSGLDQSKIDKSTEQWLDEIEDRLDYQAWYAGHYHCNKHIDKMHFLFEDWECLEN